jgi:hypothetical protein
MAELFTIVDFQSQRKSSDVETGWLNAAATYPADPNAPAADQPQVRIQHTPPADGTYLYDISATSLLDVASASTEARFTLDGGSTWEDYSRESADTSDRNTLAYNFPIDLTGGVPIDIIFQMKKESGGTLSVFFMNIWIQRVA